MGKEDNSAVKTPTCYTQESAEQKKQTEMPNAKSGGHCNGEYRQYKNKNKEQTAAANGNKEKEVSEPVSYGKFKSAEELFKSYSSLEAEFSRRCKKIKQLESALQKFTDGAAENSPDGGNVNSCGINGTADAVTPDNNSVEQNITENICENTGAFYAASQGRDYGYDAQKLLESEEFVSKYIVNSENVKKAVIAEYLKSLSSSPSPSLLRAETGQTAFSPPNKPKDLAEAKKIAEMLIGRT